MAIFLFIASALRRFGIGGNSLPQSVGGSNADAHFSTVAKIDFSPDESDELVQVDHHVGESPAIVNLHSYPLAFLTEAVVLLVA